MEPPDDSRLLRCLRDAGTDFIGWEMLGAELGLSSSLLQSALSRLEEAGYALQRSPVLGIRMTGAVSCLLADDIRSRLPVDTGIGGRVLVFARTESTNSIVLRLGEQGALHGTAVFAEEQTRGRGRQGRRWESQPGEGIWGSVLLRPPLPMAQWTRLTFWAALAAVRAMESTSPVSVMVKWPNDLFVNGRKTGGILVESRVSGSGEGFACVGVGLNTGQASFPEPLDQTATSLRMESGEIPDRNRLAAALLHQMETLWPVAMEDFHGLLAALEERNYLRDKWFSFTSEGTRCRALGGSFASDGALQVRTENGEELFLRSGEVHVNLTDM